jgi:hypothetical protein
MVFPEKVPKNQLHRKLSGNSKPADYIRCAALFNGVGRKIAVTAMHAIPG